MSAILECHDLKKAYGGKLALAGMNLSLERGQIVGLLGPNGSGKTTFIKLANALLSPTSGELRIAGEKPGIATKRIVSYLPEKTYLNDWMRVSQILEFFKDFYSDFDRTKANDMLARLGIDPNDKIKTLSKGTKEKVQLILVMSRNADLYLLDEPSAVWIRLPGTTSLKPSSGITTRTQPSSYPRTSSPTLRHPGSCGVSPARPGRAFRAGRYDPERTGENRWMHCSGRFSNAELKS